MIGAFSDGRISLTQLAQQEKVDASAVSRWRTKGIGGHRLEAVRVGGRWFTTQAAYERWRAKSNGEDGPLAVGSQ